jgi:hypothetical protein
VAGDRRIADKEPLQAYSAIVDTSYRNMPTFHDRYTAGEHERVWAELVALGEAVRHEPVYTDAVAVARETMRRAQANVETLIDRLHSLGYRFDMEQSVAQESVDRMAAVAHQIDLLRAVARGSIADRMMSLIDHVKTSGLPQQAIERMKASAAKPAAIHPLEDSSVYSRATEESAEGIADAERCLRGPLPIALRAWYETFEHVSFLGSHPELNPTRPRNAQPMMYVAPPMLQGAVGQQARQLAESVGFRLTGEAPAASRDEDALPDPLVIAPLEEVLGEAWEDDRGGDSHIISPDDLQKAHISGDMYYVDLPDNKADVVFQDWKNDYFVAYLRRVFAWGGFPGWERHANPPIKLIKELTRDLLPL